MYTLPLAAAVFSMSTIASVQSALASWKATERWRVDGTEAGEGFGQVRDFVVLRDQSLWVLDFKEQQIWRYSSSGAPLGKVSRRGSGPGELRNANGMAVAGDGTVWVNDPSNGRLTVFNTSGTFARQHVLPIAGYSYRWGGFYNAATREMIDATIVAEGGSDGRVWRRVDATGVDRGSFDAPTCSEPAVRSIYRAETPGVGSTGGQYPFTTGGGVAANGQSAIWCAGPQSTFVALLPFGKRDTLARTSVRIPPLPVSKAERDEQIALIRQRLSTYKTSDFDPAKIPVQKPGIAGLSVDDDGRLWIQHTAVFGLNTTVFDVHDAKGAHVARVTIPGKLTYGMPVKARGMSLWLAVIDDDDLVSIVHYALSK